jgi:hypothetical protein
VLHSSSTPDRRMIPHQALSHDAIGDYDVAIVVAGSRDYNDYRKFSEIIEGYLCVEVPKETVIFISGKAKTGPDDMIIRWCKEHGYAWTEFPADWDDISAPGAFVKRNRLGKLYNARAGHDRNRLMAEHASRVICFWDGFSPGTKNMIDEAERVEITPKVFFIDGDESKGKRNGGQNRETPSS